MKPGRVVLLVLGSLFALLGVGLLVGSGSLSWALATQRDSDGFFTTSSQRYAASSFAITSVPGPPTGGPARTWARPASV
jgi:predicted TPR repeat methyltransferase